MVLLSSAPAVGPLGVLTQEERVSIHQALARGERCACALRAWRARGHAAWVLTDHRVLIVEQGPRHAVRLSSVELDDLCSADVQQYGAAATLWLGTEHDVFILDGVEPESGRAFVREIEAVAEEHAHH